MSERKTETQPGLAPGSGLPGRVIAVWIKHFLITLFERVFFTNRELWITELDCVFEFNACLATSLKLNGIFIQSENRVEIHTTTRTIAASWSYSGLPALISNKVNISIMDIFNSCGNLKVEMFILLSSRCPPKLASRALSRLTLYKRNIRLMTFLFWNLLSQPLGNGLFQSKSSFLPSPHTHLRLISTINHNLQ